MRFRIKLADVVIAVDSQYDTMKTYCGDYVVDDPEEELFTVVITQDDIRKEQEETSRTEEKETQYSPQYLECDMSEEAVRTSFEAMTGKKFFSFL